MTKKKIISLCIGAVVLAVGVALEVAQVGFQRARADGQAVGQAAFGIDTDMRLHAKVPLVALLGLMHLGVTLLALVFG